MRLLFIDLLLAIIIPGSGLQAQWPLYRVYSVTGKVKLQPSGSKTAQPVIKNQFINTGDKLLLAEDLSEIILFDRDTNYIRLTKKGNYSTEDIRILKKKHIVDNITVKYCALLWEDLLKPEHSINHLDAEEISNSTGGVSRGAVQLIVPSVIFSTSMSKQLFKWKKVAGVQSYIFGLYDEENRICFRRTIIDTQIWVPIVDSLVYGNNYTWSLVLSGERFSDQPAITGQLLLVDEKRVLPELDIQVEDSLGGIVTGLQQAGAYEKAGCTKKACSIYKDLVDKNPEDPAVGKLYRSFMGRNGITDK